jgi:transcriptional regulator with XRE-family HTH domain
LRTLVAVPYTSRMGKPRERKDFGPRLDAILKARGISWAALADAAGLTREAVYRWKSGEVTPSWDSVQLVARALGAPFDALADPSLTPPKRAAPRRRGRPRGKAP